MATGEGGLCSACGTPNPTGMRFCGNCGKPLGIGKKTPQSTGDLPEFPPSATSQKKPSPPVPPTVPNVAPRRRPSAVDKPATIPTDPIQRERERERLISQANGFRAKGQVTDARETLQKALYYAEGMTPQQRAPLHEQIGDLLKTEDFFDDAIAEYKRATELDPKRSSAEKKYAEAALEKARAVGRLSDTPMHDDSLVDILTSGDLGPVGKRNAGMAMLMSLFVPGGGQFYNRQPRKGIILLGIFLTCLFLMALSGESGQLFQDILAVVSLQSGKSYVALSPYITVLAIIALGAWLYSLVDAALGAGKVDYIETSQGGPDKSGWEV